jgi:hypothetical protein
MYDRYELYDMTKDFAEAHDIVNESDYSQRKEDLKVRLKRVLEQDSLGLGTIESPQLTEDELEKLKSLGYVQ